MRRNKGSLSSAAIEDGIKSGLTEADMLSLGMRSLSRAEIAKLFRLDAEGYIIPYDSNFSRLKILQSYSKFGEKSERKYSQIKGTKPQLYMPKIGAINWVKLAVDNTQPLFITEGEKKAAAACKAGFACIGLSGIYCFRTKERGLLADWDKINLSNRNIFIVYDSDIIDKPQVRYAEYELAAALTSRGAHVSRIRLPHLSNGDKAGFDDFLVSHEFPKKIANARDAFDQLPREQIDPALPPHLTELGNAIRFENTFKEHLRFVPELKKWVIFNKASGLWREDQDGEAMRCVKTLPYILRKDADKLLSSTARDSYLAWAKSSESERNLAATLRLASSEAGLVLSREAIDSDPWKVAFKNGISMSLRTLQVSQSMPEDYLMKSFGTIYDPRAKCPQWIKFMGEILNQDKELIRYVQRVVGWCLTGDMSEQCFFILFGTGANGKSTFLNTLLALFGDYGRQASPQTFMMNKHDSSTRSDLVRLVGTRFISTSETESNQRIAESLLKQWTGGEQISTRDLYGKTFEFYPHGKIFLATNHKPKIHSLDQGIWRRIHLIPFTRTFNENEKDLGLQNKLKEELPGILNWALEGYKEWQKKGLKAPSSVIASVKAYREDMDLIGTWLQEKCEQRDEYKELISTLFDDYKEWAEDSEEHLFNKRTFVQQLQERGFNKFQTTFTNFDGSKMKGRCLTGIRLVQDIQSERQKFKKRTPKPRE